MSPAGPRTVHVNSLRWFASSDGGTEFVRTLGDGLDDATVALALTTPYPAARHLLRALEVAGVDADYWFTLDDNARADDAPADTTARDTPARDTPATPTRPSGDASLGGLALVLGQGLDHGNSTDTTPERTRIAPDAAVAGVICTDPGPDAIPRAASALADAFGPQIVWADDLADVMLVRPGMTVDQVRARWTCGQADDSSA